MALMFTSEQIKLTTTILRRAMMHKEMEVATNGFGALLDQDLQQCIVS
jgi:hypothetical protein